MEPAGPSLTKWSLNFFLGNIKNGGTWLPCALPAKAMVTNVPLSPEVMAPTCLSPLAAMTLPGTCTVISFALNLWRSRTFCKFWKKEFTLLLLKLVARCRLVAWGQRMDREVAR
ncbi:hypothetical protein PO909_015314 [Leuciscus waleckii]